MFYQMIANARDLWLAKPDCTVKDLISYIENIGQLKLGSKVCLSAAKVLLLLLTQLISLFQLIKHILRNRLNKILILPQFIEQ